MADSGTPRRRNGCGLVQVEKTLEEDAGKGTGFQRAVGAVCLSSTLGHHLVLRAWHRAWHTGGLSSCGLNGRWPGVND